MKRIIFQFLFLLLWLSPVCAQDLDVGMEIYGFRVPDYDDQGELRAQLYGGHARVLEDKVVEITNLKIEMYKKDRVAMTVFAPHCFFNIKNRRARSEGRVLIESSLMTVEGRGFVWLAEAGRFEILHESRILVKPAARAELKEMDL
jgi:hypothetical protein